MRSALSLLLILCVATLGACETTGGGCPPGVEDSHDHFKTTDFSTSTLRATNPDSSSPKPTLSPLEGDTLSDGVLAIQMRPEKVFYSHAATPFPSLRLLPAAHACSPEVPSSEETITDLRVHSSRSFRDRAPGDTLTAFFDVVAFNDADYGSRRFQLERFLSMRPRAVDELILLLTARPDTTARFQFTVTYEQNGPGLDEYEYTTPPVVLGAD